jgi:hypothetical protein
MLPPWLLRSLVQEAHEQQAVNVDFLLKYALNDFESPCDYDDNLQKFMTAWKKRCKTDPRRTQNGSD